MFYDFAGGVNQPSSSDALGSNPLHLYKYVPLLPFQLFFTQDHQSKDASSHVSGPVLLESVTPGSGGAMSGGDTRVGGEVGVNRQAVLRLPSRYDQSSNNLGIFSHMLLPEDIALFWTFLS